MTFPQWWEDGNDFLDEGCRSWYCYLYPLSVFYLVLGISAAVRLTWDVSDIYRSFLKLVMTGCFLRCVTLGLWFPLEDAINNTLETPTFLIIFFDLGGFLFLAAYLLAPACWMFGDQGRFQDEASSLKPCLAIVGTIQVISWLFSLWKLARIGCRGLSLFLWMMIYGIVVVRVLWSSCSTRTGDIHVPVLGIGRTTGIGLTTRVMTTIVCLSGLVINTFLLLSCIINIERDLLRRRDDMLCFVFFLGEMTPVFGAFNVPWLIVKLRDMKRRDLTLPSTSREDAGNDHRGESYIDRRPVSLPPFEEVPQIRYGLSSNRGVQPQTTGAVNRPSGTSNTARVLLPSHSGNPESPREAARRSFIQRMGNANNQGQRPTAVSPRPTQQQGRPLQSSNRGRSTVPGRPVGRPEISTNQSQSGRVQDNRPQNTGPVLRPPAENQGSSSRKPEPYYYKGIPIVDASSVPGLRFKKERLQCVFCLDRYQTSGYLHDLRVCKCVCRKCARQIYRSGSSCPICRERIDAIVDNI